MATISRGTKSGTGTTNFGASTTAKSSEVNTDLNTIVSAINGGLDNDNIAAGAGIASSKLDLSSISQTVGFSGTLTAANLQLTSSTLITAILDEDALTSDSAIALATQQSIKAYVDNNSILTAATLTASRLMSASGGDVSYTGVGFVPRAVVAIAAISPNYVGQKAGSFGFASSPANEAVVFAPDNNSGTTGTFSTNANSFVFVCTGASTFQQGAFKGFNSDGFDITWSVNGSEAKEAIITFLCLR